MINNIPIGKIQDAITIYDLVAAKGVDDPISYLRDLVAQFEESQKIVGSSKGNKTVLSPVCPVCGELVLLKKLCPKSNKKGYKLLVYCSSMTCLFEKYHKDEWDSVISHYINILTGDINGV